MSLMNKLSNKAKTFANDPKTREKIEDARVKLNEHVETAKQKMAEKKGKDEEARTGSGSDATPSHGEEAQPRPPYGEDGPKAA